MECYFCQESLYQTITFKTIFKLNYEVHETCFLKHQLSENILSFPVNNYQIHLFAIFYAFKDSFNENSLFRLYGNRLFTRIIMNKKTNYLILDEKDKNLITTKDLELILPIFGHEVYFYSLFQNNIISL